ncbi:MAG: SDR family NAD-dependent epimerase/dehydratase, partial [Propionibacteriaceae bacterium]|nr:SDR family NAD-dependent epimerase/dehydratase [Propionibacteriaceae bacterium]
SGQAYNVAHPSNDIHLKDLAGLVAKTAGTQVVFELPSEQEQRGFSAATIAAMDGTKLASLGWRPSRTIAEGVERTVTILREIGT